MTMSAPDAPGRNGWNHSVPDRCKPTARSDEDPGWPRSGEHVGQVRAARLLLVDRRRRLVSSCIRAGSRPGGADVNRACPAWDGRPAGRPPGARRASRSREAAQRRLVRRARTDRAPRTPSRSPVEDEPAVPDDEGQVVRSRAGRLDGPERRRRRPRAASQVGELADRRTAAAGRHRARSRTGMPRRSATASAPAAWSGSTWVRATASIGPPRSAARASARSSAGPGRVARIDEHEPAAPDEVGAHRLAGDAAPGRHDDPGDRRRRRSRPRPRRAVRAPAAREPRRGRRRARAAGGSCSSAATARAGRRPSPRARRSGAARRGRRPRRPRRSASRPSGRAAAKNRASNRRGRVGGVTQRDSGTSRSVRSRRSSASARSGKRRRRRASSAERASAIVAADAVVVGEEDAGLLEQLADRGEERGEGDRRRQVATQRQRRRRPPNATERPASAGSRVPGVDPAAGKDVGVRRERHRRRALRQEDLEPGRARPEQDDGRGRPGLHRAGGHPGSSDRDDMDDRAAGRPAQPSAVAAASSWARSAAASVTGSRQTKPRQTYAVGRPSRATRSASSGTAGGPRIGGQRDDLVGAPAAPDLGDEGGRGRIIRRADDGDLDDRPERQVHRRQPLGEPGRIARHERHDRRASRARRRPGTPLARSTPPAAAGPGPPSRCPTGRRCPGRPSAGSRAARDRRPYRRTRRPDRRTGRARDPSAPGRFRNHLSSNDAS